MRRGSCTAGHRTRGRYRAVLHCAIGASCAYRTRVLAYIVCWAQNYESAIPPLAEAINPPARRTERMPGTHAPHTAGTVVCCASSCSHHTRPAQCCIPLPCNPLQHCHWSPTHAAPRTLNFLVQARHELFILGPLPRREDVVYATPLWRSYLQRVTPSSRPPANRPADTPIGAPRWKRPTRPRESDRARVSNTAPSSSR